MSSVAINFLTRVAYKWPLGAHRRPLSRLDTNSHSPDLAARTLVPFWGPLHITYPDKDRVDGIFEIWDAILNVLRVAQGLTNYPICLIVTFSPSHGHKICALLAQPPPLSTHRA